MHAPQGIAGLIVIELRYGTDGPPPTRCMAVLAWKIQVPVRAVSPGGILRPRRARVRGTGQ